MRGGPLSGGRVTVFDGDVGLGQVEEDGTGAAYPFHCTQIAGGGRSVEVGAAVTFSVAPGRMGRWEAVGVTVVDVGAVDVGAVDVGGAGPERPPVSRFSGR